MLHNPNIGLKSKNIDQLFKYPNLNKIHHKQRMFTITFSSLISSSPLWQNRNHFLKLGWRIENSAPKKMEDDFELFCHGKFLSFQSLLFPERIREFWHTVGASGTSGRKHEQRLCTSPEDVSQSQDFVTTMQSCSANRAKKGTAPKPTRRPSLHQKKIYPSWGHTINHSRDSPRLNLTNRFLISKNRERDCGKG